MKYSILFREIFTNNDSEENVTLIVEALDAEHAQEIAIDFVEANQACHGDILSVEPWTGQPGVMVA